MINANELRVGNRVIIDGEISELDEDAMEFLFSSRNFSVLLPIPLTPEILEACGFEKDGFGNYNLSINPFDKGTNKLFFTKDYLYLQQGREDEHPMDHDLVTLWNKDLMKDFYLHQLQNIHFFLTQTELIYQP